MDYFRSLILRFCRRVDPVVELAESSGLPLDVNQNGGYSSVVMIRRVLELSGVVVVNRVNRVDSIFFCGILSG